MAIGRLNKDKIPSSGSTDTRSSNPALGDTHYNGTLGQLEIYTSQGWMAVGAAPQTPTEVTATNAGSNRTYNNGSASVAFTPSTLGGLPTIYTVTSSPGSYTATGSSSPIIVSGQQSATSYTYTVVASNNYGTASTSSASSAVTATTVPQAPTIGAVTANDGFVTVAYTANATGGSEITTFTATSNPGSLTGTGASPITVSGLTNGTAYTFTVTATNANGTSAPSSSSSSATPIVPITADILVVAGGGGGGSSTYGGGGGAGGYVYSPAYPIARSTNYAISIGAGGTAPGNSRGGNGVDSSFSTIYTATGGGGGGSWNQNRDGASGGSGGGASENTGAGTAGSATQASYGGLGFGNNGGPMANGNEMGGGGGAGAAGTTSAGGIGKANSITGSSIYYAGGGGGSSRQSASRAGGLGGGGIGGQASGTTTPGNGDANTGGGGGGRTNENGQGGGTGGSGVVILKYPNTETITVGAGLTASHTNADAGGGNKYTRITAGTGNVSWA